MSPLEDDDDDDEDGVMLDDIGMSRVLSEPGTTSNDTEEKEEEEEEEEEDVGEDCGLATPSTGVFSTGTPDDGVDDSGDDVDVVAEEMGTCPVALFTFANAC